jgi:mRNA-degrading endonuclease RelE of RelBE toxin-antitoxin system
MFSIFIHRKALKEIDGFSAEDKERIMNAIRQMATEPFSGDVKPVKGVKGVLRRRVGDYRIAFTVNFEKSEVVVLRVGRRERFYQEP